MNVIVIAGRVRVQTFLFACSWLLMGVAFSAYAQGNSKSGLWKEIAVGHLFQAICFADMKQATEAVHWGGVEIFRGRLPSWLQVTGDEADPCYFGLAISHSQHGNAIEYAAMRGGVGIMTFMIEQVPQTERPAAAGEGLLQAIYWQQWNVARVLLTKGARVDVCYPSGRGLLHEACVKLPDNQDELFRALLRRGAVPHEIAVDSGQTPLHLAAGMGKPRLTKVLLQAGADPNLQNADGMTPLAVAIERPPLSWLLRSGDGIVYDIVRGISKQDGERVLVPIGTEREYDEVRKLLTEYGGRPETHQASDCKP